MERSLGKRFEATLPLVRTVILALLVASTLTSAGLLLGPESPPAAGSDILHGPRFSPSWNSATSCTAQLMTLEEFTGSVVNPKEIPPSAGADYSGGLMRLAGDWPAGTNVASSKWPFSKRALPNQVPDQLPCSKKLDNGTQASTLAEIHSLTVLGIAANECGYRFPGICDLTFHLCKAVLSPRCNWNTYPDTMHIAYAEIDMYWQNAKIAPILPPVGSTIDVQGFAYWDDAHITNSWHSFSGWELHPFTAWRLSGEAKLHASFNHTPNGAPLGETMKFIATTAGGTPPYSFGWDFGDGGTASESTTTHSFNTARQYNVTLSVADYNGFRTTTSQVVSITRPPDFQTVIDPPTLYLTPGSSGSMTVTVSSIGTFNGQVNLSADPISSIIEIQLAKKSVTLSAGQSASIGLAVLARRDVSPGSYVLILRGIHESVARSGTATINIPNFDLSVDSSFLDTNPDSLGSFSLAIRSMAGFGDPVSLSATSSPPGMTIVLEPSTVQLVAGNSTTVNLDVRASTPDNYTLLVTGSSGAYVRKLQLSVEVDSPADFAITPNSTSTTQDPASPQVMTFTLSSLNGFQGRILLTANSSPLGPVISLPSNLTLSPGTIIPVSMTITTMDLPARNYTITVIGASGIITHTAKMDLVVQRPHGASIYLPSLMLLTGIAVVISVKIGGSSRLRLFASKTG
jgi:PKD repeat protein